jgi:hypothetical protein
MRSLPELVYSKDKNELINQMDRIHRELAEFYRELPLNRINLPADPEGWSARKNLHHITAINRLIAGYIGLPVWLLRLRGKPPSDARKFEDIVPTNRPRISDYGTYRQGKALDPQQRDRDVSDFLESAQMLARATGGKTEEELDSLQSPFGGMTLRMLAHFALKHSLHHSSVVRFRMENR